jgi:hypothetical protein
MSTDSSSLYNDSSSSTDWNSNIDSSDSSSSSNTTSTSVDFNLCENCEDIQEAYVQVKFSFTDLIGNTFKDNINDMCKSCYYNLISHVVNDNEHGTWGIRILKWYIKTS